ncbi:MAG: 2-oxoacid:ferredoxin oxidoreductase subunit gamma [Firmicutes bacterium]|nr:2-oxoacid:ferredoxin oxidoreductase subunit gamma [Bacillota bacterium]
METSCEICLSGSGGQGLILAGIILARAATDEGKNVIQTQSYGPEARGGACRSEVIISNEEIDYLTVEKPDILLSLTRESYERYQSRVKDGGIIVVDSSCKIGRKGENLRIYPIIKTVREVLGTEFVANIMALGAITALTKIISPNYVKGAIAVQVPPHTVDLNLKAFALGYEMVQKDEDSKKEAVVEG